MKALYFLSLCAVMLLAACGGSRGTGNLAPEPTQAVIKSMPDWFTNIPQDPNYMFASASATSRDLQVAVNKAQADGRNQIAQQLEVKYSGLTKRFQEEVGLGEDSELLDQYTQAYKAVVSQVLNGTRAREQKVVPDQGIYRAYVLMEMPIGEANQALMGKIKANQNMYTRFRATQAFEDLNTEVERYEQWKREQGAGQ